MATDNDFLCAPLAKKDIVVYKKWQERVMFFNPKEIYQRLNIDHYKRMPSVSITDVFPKKDKLCGCGCGVELSGRRSRWASEECSKFAVEVWAIISGYKETISRYVRLYHGQSYTCFKCGSSGDCDELDLDHIIPVKHGGGGWWLGNYQMLCKPCHKQKTAEDFKYKSHTEKSQLKLFA